MAHEVVVVGGGIGGLTAAALLAARGVDVCLLERQSQVGGCVASLEKFDYLFEPTLGLYSGWGEGEIHKRIFSELGVAEPETLPLNPAYVVRLPEGLDITVAAETAQFEEELRQRFPECASAAVRFYREAQSISDILREALLRMPDFATASNARRLSAFLPRFDSLARLLALRNRTVSQQLKDTSARFQHFVELELLSLGGNVLPQCSYLAASLLLNCFRRNPVAISGGAAAICERLAASIRQSGGRVRLDSPVLRLSYDSQGGATGVDLLSGETLSATKAVVSNLTVWDTYGKLIGLDRTPLDLKKRLTQMRSLGAYLIYAGIDESAVARMPADRMLIATKSSAETNSMIDASRFCFSAAPREDARGPQGMRAVTIVFPTDVDEWFTYQAEAEEHERRDQAALEVGWQTIHANMPELGADIEVIETATPQTYYEQTRRKLGMVGGLGYSSFPGSVTHLTTLPNVFIVGDTTFPGYGVGNSSHSALIVANEITKI